MFIAAPAFAADEPPTGQAIAAATTVAAAHQPAPLSPALVRVRQQRSLVLPSLYVSLSALQAYDVYSTLTALGHGATEANPMMQGVVGNPTAFVALKSAVLLMVASNGLMAYVARHNASVLGNLR
jgi:hypothetical protein